MRKNAIATKTIFFYICGLEQNYGIEVIKTQMSGHACHRSSCYCFCMLDNVYVHAV